LLFKDTADSDLAPAHSLGKRLRIPQSVNTVIANVRARRTVMCKQCL